MDGDGHGILGTLGPWPNQHEDSCVDISTVLARQFPRVSPACPVSGLDTLIVPSTQFHVPVQPTRVDLQLWCQSLAVKR